MHERRDNVLGTDVLGNFRLALECANLNFPTLETFEMALMRSFKLLLTAVNATRVNRLMGVLSPGEWVDPAGSGLDAEQNLLRYIEGRGLIIRGLGASRDICMDKCWPEIVNAGVIDVVGTPNKGGTWIPFWMR